MLCGDERQKFEVRHEKTRGIIFILHRTNDCTDSSVELTNASLSVSLELHWADDTSGRVATTFVHILLVGELTDERRQPRRQGFRVQSFLSEA